MHMWMWFGFDLGEFLFSGLVISTRWAFALTWIVLFLVAVLFEGSKVYLARVQREAHKKLHPYRSDERRNLLCDRAEVGVRMFKFKLSEPMLVPESKAEASETFAKRFKEQPTMEPTTSRDASSGQVSRWATFKVRTLVNSHQTAVFLAHNVVGYLLMLCVMVYNVHLLVAVVSGMMLGYFLFGTKLTRLQMKCFGTKRVVICTPECDDTAENTTPPLLNSSSNSDSDVFTCQTRTCIQPSHYFRASTSQDTSTSCHFGAKNCPSKVARAKKLQATPSHCHLTKTDKEDSPGVEGTQLLSEERHGCCKKQEQEKKCCKSSQTSATVLVHEGEGCSTDREEVRQDKREDSPQITCCHNTKLSSESQEQILKVD